MFDPLWNTPNPLVPTDDVDLQALEAENQAAVDEAQGDKDQQDQEFPTPP